MLGHCNIVVIHLSGCFSWLGLLGRWCRISWDRVSLPIVGTEMCLVMKELVPKWCNISSKMSEIVEPLSGQLLICQKRIDLC